MADADAIHALVYRSEETAPLSPDAVAELLRDARRNNERHSVTGVLIYGGGVFVQYLEGPRLEVNNLFMSISRDPRHHDVWQMGEGPIAERVFPDWSMSYRALTPEIIATLPGAVDPVEALRTILGLKSSSMMTILLKSLTQALLGKPPDAPPGA
jgi:hypothetical protein